MKRNRWKMAALAVAWTVCFVTPCFAGTETGWVYNDETEAWNYYSPDGELAANQWLKEGDSLFWINEDGSMAVCEWHQEGRAWYWLDASGTAAVGWQEIDGKWYYFNKDNTMAVSQYIDGFYVGRDGAWIIGRQ